MGPENVPDRGPESGFYKEGRGRSVVQTVVQKGVQIRVLRVHQQDTQRDGESGVLRGMQKGVLRVDWTWDLKWVLIMVLIWRVGS